MENNSQNQLFFAIAVGAAGVIFALWMLNRKKITGPPVTLEDHEKKYEVKLMKKVIINHDTRRFVFQLPSSEHILGLPIGQHVFIVATIDGKMVLRPYTPVTSDEDKGHMDLVVKIYFKNVHPKFPDGGKMSQFLDNLKLGDSILIRGPRGRLVYKGDRQFAITEDKKLPTIIKTAQNVGMIAGGTGITPMLQLISHCLKEPQNDMNFWLLFANQTEDDILVRNELEGLANQHGDRFNLWYTLDRPGENWSYSSGFISEEMIRNHLPPPSDDTLIVMCGPPPMIKFACLPNLEKLGHKSSQCFAY